MKATITIEFEKHPNGNCEIHRKIEAEGFAMFELIGLMEIAKHAMIEESKKMAKDKEQKQQHPTQEPA